MLHKSLTSYMKILLGESIVAAWVDTNTIKLGFQQGDNGITANLNRMLAYAKARLHVFIAWNTT